MDMFSQKILTPIVVKVLWELEKIRRNYAGILVIQAYGLLGLLAVKLMLHIALVICDFCHGLLIIIDTTQSKLLWSMEIITDLDRLTKEMRTPLLT